MRWGDFACPTEPAWAAHLCIHLNDINERNHHAGLTSSIFQNARQVIVWMGSAGMKGPGTSIPSICKVINMWRARSGLTDQIPEATFSKMPKPLTFVADTLQETRYVDIGDAWISAIRLFSYPWFRIIWSIPEVTVARSVVLIQGNKAISWDWIGIAAAILIENYARPRSAWLVGWTPGKRPIVDPGILTAYFMYRMSVCQSHFEPLRVSFLQLISFSHAFMYRLDQGRIYALIGVPTVDSNSVSSKIVPDYSKPAGQVNLEIAQLIIQRPTSLNLLAEVRSDHNCRLMKPGSLYPKDLVLSSPSWCPQWHVHIHGFLVDTILPPWPCSGYQASGVSLGGV